MSDDGLHMQIGQVAQRTELSIRTVRHYDDVGLVTPSARTAGGFRLYTEADVERLLVIRRMKPLDFTLAEMKQLLESLDVVSDADASEDSRSSAADFVGECHTKAEESCRTLRRQLAYAEELTELLSARGAAAEP
ncbi:putative MerR family transcriptional regulator [Rhodococcus sp. AW25M09]|uniref:MerR family transcriptional regulator n=1 Tax=Rhodococcus sp. AW25M09 TaxID=1268303 RepID=UPI0002ACFBD9|nr:MerR family transcriptional regulator [Rhodococcus sp. AW25M09]CCQ13831.1 putative MerR family transcriptional regulator [Rhodococcus sp. AW25M09]